MVVCAIISLMLMLAILAFVVWGMMSQGLEKEDRWIFWGFFLVPAIVAVCQIIILVSAASGRQEQIPSRERELELELKIQEMMLRQRNPVPLPTEGTTK